MEKFKSPERKTGLRAKIALAALAVLSSVACAHSPQRSSISVMTTQHGARIINIVECPPEDQADDMLAQNDATRSAVHQAVCFVCEESEKDFRLVGGEGACYETEVTCGGEGEAEGGE
jgi:hypothetical protein